MNPFCISPSKLQPHRSVPTSFLAAPKTLTVDSSTPSEPLPSEPLPDHPSENAAYPRSQPRRHLSGNLLRNAFGTCHVSRRSSRKLPRKPFEAARETLRSYLRNAPHVPEYPKPGGIPPDAARPRHLSPSA